MSTLCSGWRPPVANPKTERFQYPAVETAVLSALSPEAADEERLSLRERTLEEHNLAAVQAALEQGRREGAASAKASMELVLDEVRAAVEEALVKFAQQRENYFRRVEADLVRLSLSIARRVLYREAQIDPLMLAGVVRVALDRMHAGTSVTLRCQPAEVELWRRCLQTKTEAPRSVNITADPELKPHHCILEAEVGSADISLEGRLQEIESGFFDLLADRPEQKSNDGSALSLNIQTDNGEQA